MSSIAAAITSTSGLISYPTPTPTPPTPSPAPAAPAQLLRDRLYVGNLHPTVDEYTLLQLFSKHGKVSKLDFLFHKTGPAKGKPRGYAFVEYGTKEDAAKALVGLHDRLVRGRRLVVTFAHQAPQTDMSSRPNRRPGTDTTRPTTLSLLKTHNRPEATKDKIAALEAKLRQMEQKPQSFAPLTVLPSSLPQKPLLSTLPTVPAGGAQRKPGTSSSSSFPLGLRASGSSASLSTGLSLPRPSSSSSGSSTQGSLAKAPRLGGAASLPPKPGSILGHRHSSSSLGVALKR
ncbi:RNA-binding domain-containing protein [Ramaria rubella]|nr:RNA-binding domain-containing protein [Ramaria rubella]